MGQLPSWMLNKLGKHQVRADFKFSFDKTKKWLIFHFVYFIFEKMVKEGLWLLSCIKYINLLFKLINAF